MSCIVYVHVLRWFSYSMVQSTFCLFHGGERTDTHGVARHVIFFPCLSCVVVCNMEGEVNMSA